MCILIILLNYKYTHEKSDLYEQYYVDGRDISLVFPEKKRNLIYIYLESMETTFADRASGGVMESNLMPELSALALENIDFSESGVLNGAYSPTGTTYTMGALVAQTSGVAVNGKPIVDINEWESENGEYLLPGAWTIGDILASEGYEQTFMIGSDGKFAGRSLYFTGHGGYHIKDYYTALEEGWIPEGYYVWWGYEDTKLIEFAKKEIVSLADSDAPFNFTMLTVDTHFTDGYVCELCNTESDVQYDNVISCSSRQIAAFVDWIRQQAFYENTTIVIAGDHPTMDYNYITEKGVADYDRRVYVAIINPAENCKSVERERQYTTLDLFPTTLAALGVQIPEERLGLGVNLFSETPTLYEEYGRAYVNRELLKYSDLYTKKLLYR